MKDFQIVLKGGAIISVKAEQIEFPSTSQVLRILVGLNQPATRAVILTSEVAAVVDVTPSEREQKQKLQAEVSNRRAL